MTSLRRNGEPVKPPILAIRGLRKSFLSHGREVTALRLVTLHNLSFVARLMEDLREAIDAGRLREVSKALASGSPPAGLSTSCSN